jgi:hypothetical protein
MQDYPAGTPPPGPATEQQPDRLSRPPRHQSTCVWWSAGRRSSRTEAPSAYARVIVRPAFR